MRKENQETKEIKVLKDLMDLTVILVNLVNLVLMEPTEFLVEMENQVTLDERVLQAVMVMMVPKETKGFPVTEVLRARTASKALQGLKELQVRKAFQVGQVNLVIVVIKGQMVTAVSQATLVLVALTVIRVSPVRQAPLVQQDEMVSLVALETRAQKENLVTPAKTGQMALLVLLALQVFQANQDQKERLEIKDQKARRDQVAMPELMVQRVLKENQDLMDPMGFPAIQEVKDLMEHLVKTEPMVFQVNLVSRAQMVTMVLRVPTVSLATKGPLATKVPMGRLATLVDEVLKVNLETLERLVLKVNQVT